MTPKEKAEDLVHQYRLILLQSDSELSHEINLTIYAKQCALIAVNQVIKEYKIFLQSAPSFDIDYIYWQEVKQEIEKL